MKKIIVIEGCFKCIYRKENGWFEYVFCTHPDASNTQILKLHAKGFPKWCPLDNYTKSNSV